MTIAQFNQPWWTPSGSTPRLLIGQTVTVYQDDAGVQSATKQTLFTDETGSTTSPNPFVVDAAGNVKFYADASRVWVKVGAYAAERVQIPSSGKSSATAPSYTQAGLPSAANPGDLAWVSDDIKGLRVASGVEWVGQESVDPITNGLRGDGSADDSAALIALLPKCAGKRIAFPPRPFRFASKVPVGTRSVILRGTPGDLGLGTVFRTAANIDILEFAAGSPGSRVEDIGFWHTGTATAGSGVKIAASIASMNGTGTTPIEVAGCSFLGLYDGIVMEGGNVVRVMRPLMGGIKRDGIRQSGGIELYVLMPSIKGPGRHGINLEADAAATHILGGDIWGAVGDGFRGAGLGQVFVKQLVSDMCQGSAFSIGGSGAIYDFEGCWAAGAGLYGMDINQFGGGGLSWRGGQIRYNGRSGVRLGGSGVKYSFDAGAQVGGNGVALVVGDRYGFKVLAGRSHFAIRDLDIGAIPGDATGQQTHGIFIEPGASDHYDLRGNRDTGNTVALVSDGGTGNNKWVEGTAWVYPAFATPAKYANTGGGYVPFSYRRLGHKLQFRGTINATGANAGDPIFVFPPGFRPANIETVIPWPTNYVFTITPAGVFAPAVAPGTTGLNFPFTEVDLRA